jgi:hypothetical protein
LSYKVELPPLISSAPASSKSRNLLFFQAPAEVGKMFSTIAFLALALAAQAAPTANVIGSMYNSIFILGSNLKDS